MNTTEVCVRPLDVALTAYQAGRVLLRGRFSCVPVDFEVVNVNSSLTNEDDISNAITAIRRNGVALKGQCSALLLFKLNRYQKVPFFLSFANKK